MANPHSNTPLEVWELKERIKELEDVLLKLVSACVDSDLYDVNYDDTDNEHIVLSAAIITLSKNPEIDIAPY